MKIFKSYFWYSKSQRNGIFVLVVLIIILQSILFINPFQSNEKVSFKNSEILALQLKVDSLREIELNKRKIKIYPFNPNYISDFKGQQLGLTLNQIDRLHKYRAEGKFINSEQDFKRVAEVSDSLLNILSPYFKFPDWVRKNKRNSNENNLVKINYESATINPLNIANYKFSTNDINKAKKEDFLNVEGVDQVISERIIKYRSKLQGFSYKNQLNEVWGIDDLVVDRILLNLKILEKPIIQKYNVNTIEFKQLLKNPYIDYDLCKKIFDYRDEVAELQDISELKNIKGFPQEKYDRIVLYLLAE